MSSYMKTKSAVKVVRPRSKDLNEKVLHTMRTISDIVGSTLGPGGSAVLIERQEFGLAPIVTKDGVTVMSSLGFADPISHVVYEAARDAAVRTVSEAGDGTTTATVLAHALVSETQKYAANHPDVPPQSIVRAIQSMFEDTIEPTLRDLAAPVEFDTAEGKRLLRSVARVSANGEDALADAVLHCFSLVGDKGNVSLSEKSGPSGYLVEKTEGYPIPVGYEDSLGKFMQGYINDQGNNRVYLENPSVILYNGTISDYNSLLPVLIWCQEAFVNKQGSGKPFQPDLPTLKYPGIVLIANGFSDTVIGNLMLQWRDGDGIKVVPLKTPRSPLQNGEVHFLEDIAAVTGANVFDPLSKSLETFAQDMSDMGQAKEFEMGRFRSNLIGVWDEEELIERIEVVEKMASTAVSELDRRLLQERVASLSGGIAKLVVVGSSNADIKERKDRADDAVRAVQGALKYGVLLGGGWGLRMAADAVMSDDRYSLDLRNAVLRALIEPIYRLHENAGIPRDASNLPGATVVLDVATHKRVDAHQVGLFDSVPAVIEAIRNSISIATLLGTLGGVVVFERDREMERREASAAEDYNRNANTQEANERW